MKPITCLIALILTTLTIPTLADTPQIKSNSVYRTIDGKELIVQIWYPENWKASDKRPALVCYHGGGWVKGTPGHFAKQSAHFAKRGMVCMSFAYRLLGKNAKNVADCLVDAKAAYRWTVANAGKLGIDANKIVLMGGSAGGHLAAAVALCPDPDTTAEPLPTKPFAMVLYNPVVDVVAFCKTRPSNVKGIDPKSVSPIHHLSKDAPPTLVLHGTADPVVPFEIVKRFVDGLKDLGVDATLIPYEGRKHGFFNAKKGQMEDHAKSIADADAFLVRLGLLESAK